jgi:hypothetical protein
MFKKFLLIIFTLITITSLSGCSLFSSDSEEQETAVAEDSDAESVEGSTEEDSELDEMATTEEGSSTDEAAGADTVAASDDEEEVVDEYPDDDYGDEADEVLADKSEGSSDLPDEPVEEKKEESLYVDGSQEETPSYADSSVQDNLTDSSQNFIPVRKMKKTPYTDGGVLVNRLYVAREGDTLKSVAQKIYGDSSRSKDILSWNPHFAGKGLSVGDKVYYSSPKNPQDNSAILLYYEEAGIQPSYYTAKNGESIRKVSQTLLGHPRSWMEVWATNDIESKWEMPEGAQLRYWPNGTVAAPMQAAAPEPTQPEEEAMPAETPATTTETAAMDTPEQTEPMTEPMEETPPADEGAAATAMAQNEEPPPPPPEATPPPPPPPPEAMPTPETEMAANGEGGLADMMNGENDSMMMAVLGGLLLLAAMILVVFIRRGRKKAYG